MKRAFLLLLACHLCFLLTTTSTFSQETTRRRVVSQQSPQDYSEGESLKIGVEYVQVVFSVVDEQGRPVTDLTGAQVELLEDGRLQQIELFQKSNSLPMVLSILIDISGSQEFLLPDEKTAVDTFLDNFFRDGKDYGAIATFQGETELISGLTSNLKRLKSSLKRIKRQQSFRDEEGEVSNIGTALYDAIITSCREVLDAKTARRITGDDGSSSSTTRRAIRRAMIVLSDGKDTASDGSLRKAIRNAQRLGISVYALGMGDRFRFSDVDREVLDRICMETGGRAFYPKNEKEMESAFRQIAEELSSQYILAYYPSTNSQTGFREIDISIPADSRLRVIHRRGYVTDENSSEK